MQREISADCLNAWVKIDSGKKSETTDDFEEFQNTFSTKDGGALHQKVSPDMWCVTRRDLKHFRRYISRAVREGRLVPTEMDNFDPKDDVIGPSMPTVCEQVIKPVTLKAGGQSWALMRHPQGVQCDLFVTHNWSEGVYEFIDKVLQCWPRGARYAYCCMLSNPQNLDVGSLLDSPQSSPFAAALQSAKYMLVVPNKRASIYTRIWCIYEAYLAYSWNKFIYTASAPIRDLPRRMLLMACLSVVCMFLGWLIAEHVPVLLNPYIFLCWVFGAIGVTVISVVWVKLPLLHSVLNHMSAGLHALLTGFSIGLVIAETPREGIFEVVPPKAWVSLLAAFVIASCCFESDRLFAAEAEEEAACLRKGFTGKVSDAQASKTKDRESILREIISSGKVEEVENAVKVLINAGMSTPSLRSAAALGANVQSAGKWSLGMVMIVLIMWIQHPAIHAFYDSSCSGFFRVVPYIKVVQGFIWLAFFYLSGPDMKGFAANAAGKIAVAPYLVVWSFWAGGVATFSSSCCHRLHCEPDAFGAFVLGPLMLVLSMVGVAGVARIRCIGPWLVHRILSKDVSLVKIDLRVVPCGSNSLPRSDTGSPIGCNLEA